jgi:signal transduction histidine kinase
MSHPRAKDAALAAVVFAVTLGVLAADGFGTPEPGFRALDALGVVLTAAGTLPLVFRRSAPVAVFAVVGVASAVVLGLGYPLDLPVAPAVAAYDLAVVYSGAPSRLARWSALTAVLAFVPLAAAAFKLGDTDVSDIVPELLGWELFFLTVWLFGDRARMRTAQYAEMRERAERAEREAARERQLAAAEERTRIARELHDSAGHAINVILVQAGAARLLQEQDPERARRSLETIEEVARETIGEIDRLVRALREDGDPEPPPADPSALEELVERHRSAGLEVAAEVRGPRGRVPRSVAWASYRILQEALTNAARHGKGRADVAVVFGDERLEISVRNRMNGASRGGGHGIVGMRERATLLGGTLEARADGGTFWLHAELPYGEARAA